MIPRKTETTSQYSLAIAVTAVATRFATKPSSTRQIHQFATLSQSISSKKPQA
jgi:hypothetical protein